MLARPRLSSRFSGDKSRILAVANGSGSPTLLSSTHDDTIGFRSAKKQSPLMSWRRPPHSPNFISRRDFIRCSSLSLAAGMTTRLRADMLQLFPGHMPQPACAKIWADYRVTPRYPVESALDSMLSQVRPGHDAYVSEVYAEEVAMALADWSAALCQNPVSLGPIVQRISPAVAATSLSPREETSLRDRAGLQVWRGQFTAEPILGREAFIKELNAYFRSSWRLRTAEFEVAGISIVHETPLLFTTRIRYDL